VLLEVPFAGIDAAFLETCRHVRSHGFRLLIAPGIPAGPTRDERLPWHAPHQRRVRAAMAAARLSRAR
jgi:hypothetical protein